jgi:hypothetical protein
MKTIDYMDYIFGVYCIAVIAFVCYATYLMSVGADNSDIQKQAVKHGYAEYVVDSDGKTTWQWKEEKHD